MQTKKEWIRHVWPVSAANRPDVVYHIVVRDSGPQFGKRTSSKTAGRVEKSWGDAMSTRPRLRQEFA